MASRRAIGLRPEMLMLPRPHRPSMMTNHMARVRKTYGSVMESIGKRKPSRARTRTDRSFSWEICPKIAWGPCGRPRRPRCPRSVGSRSPSRQNGRGDLAISRQSPCRCAGLFRSIVLDLLPFVVVALPLFPHSLGRRSGDSLRGGSRRGRGRIAWAHFPGRRPGPNGSGGHPRAQRVLRRAEPRRILSKAALLLVFCRPAERRAPSAGLGRRKHRGARWVQRPSGGPASGTSGARGRMGACRGGAALGGRHGGGGP